MKSFLAIILLLSYIVSTLSFALHSKWGLAQNRRQSSLYFFDKVFEEEGPLGKGITVGKVQVALMSPDRGIGSIFKMLEDNSRWIADDNEASSLADLAHDVCLTLLRKKDIWTAACSDSKWFSSKDSGKAESLYNEWANNEAAKFEKQYVPDVANDGGATIVVVSLVIEIEGDSTVFEGAGYSLAGTQAVLNSIASNCKIDDGEVTRAVEVFWTPGDPSETLTSRDIIADFPELIDV